MQRSVVQEQDGKDEGHEEVLSDEEWKDLGVIDTARTLEHAHTLRAPDNAVVVVDVETNGTCTDRDSADRAITERNSTERTNTDITSDVGTTDRASTALVSAQENLFECPPPTRTVSSGGLDYSRLSLKKDHVVRPLWLFDSCRIVLECFSPLYKEAYDFVISIAEPLCRYYHDYAETCFVSTVDMHFKTRVDARIYMHS